MCTNRAHSGQFIFSLFVEIRFFLQITITILIWDKTHPTSQPVPPGAPLLPTKDNTQHV